MRDVRPWAGVAALLTLSLVLFGCSDLPTAPEAEEERIPLVPPGPSFALFEGATLHALEWKYPLWRDRSVTREIGRKGGSVRMSWPRVTLTIPKGAISKQEQSRFGGKKHKTIPITMTLYSGEGLAVGFAPHGLQFSKPVTLVIDLRWTKVAGVSSAARDPKAVYFEGKPEVTVIGQEALPVRIEGGKLYVEINHFSGYLLASG